MARVYLQADHVPYYGGAETKPLSLCTHRRVHGEKQAAYSELNYHHRNDYRDYQIKFSSLRLTVFGDATTAEKLGRRRTITEEIFEH
jgi:hypothetical protein